MRRGDWFHLLGNGKISRDPDPRLERKDGDSGTLSPSSKFSYWIAAQQSLAEETSVVCAPPPR